MNSEQAINALQALHAASPIVAHRDAETIVLTFLEANGHKAVADAYKTLAKAKGGTP